MSRSKKDQYEIDPEDGLIRGIIGAWSAEDKHERLKRYIFASHGARKRFWKDYGKDTGFVDLYCGPGRAKIRETESHVVDGSAIIAAKSGAACTPFQRFVIGDVNSELVSACKIRLQNAGVEKIYDFVGPAEETAQKAIDSLNKSSLNLGFVDPFNADLPFSVIATLSKIKKMDLLIHFSGMDFKRNMNAMMEDGRLEDLAPGWRSVISENMSINQKRDKIFQYWRGLLENKLNYKVNDKIIRVNAPNNAEIYRLVFASRNELPDRLWSDVSNIDPQQALL